MNQSFTLKQQWSSLIGDAYDDAEERGLIKILSDQSDHFLEQICIVASMLLKNRNDGNEDSIDPCATYDNRLCIIERMWKKEKEQ